MVQTVLDGGGGGRGHVRQFIILYLLILLIFSDKIQWHRAMQRGHRQPTDRRG